MSYFKFSPILKVTEKDVTWANMMFGFHHVSGIWDDKLFNSKWQQDWIGETKLMGLMGSVWNRWIINNCLVKYDNISIVAMKYIFDSTVDVADIEKFVKSRITPGEKSEGIRIANYREYRINSPKLLSFQNRKFDCGGVPDESLPATHKEVDNVRTYHKIPKKILLKIYPGCKRATHVIDKRKNLKQYMCDQGSEKILPEQYFGVLRGDSSDYDNPYSAVIIQLRYRKSLYTKYTLCSRMQANPAHVLPGQ